MTKLIDFNQNWD